MALLPDGIGETFYGDPFYSDPLYGGSGEAFGGPQLNGFIHLTAIPGGEAFGGPSLVNLGHPGVVCGNWAAHNRCHCLGPKKRRCDYWWHWA
jgi:hypothetical protein